MKKNFQNQNTNPNKSDKVKQMVSSTIKQIAFSIVVPVKEQGENFEHFVETIKKIKHENYSKFELIIVNNNASEEVLSSLETNEIFKTLNNQNLIKIINTDSGIEKTKAIYHGICNASKDNVLVFDIDKLSNSFNINDLFSVKKDISQTIGIPVFQTKEKSKKNYLDYSLLIAPLNIAKILYANLLPSDNKYQVEVKYKINQMQIEVEELPVFQSSPFEDLKPPHICVRVFRTFLSRLNWFFLTPLKELANKPDRSLLPDKLKESSIYRFAFATMAVILFFLIPMMSYHTGNSGDEDNFQYPQALKIYKYYSTFGNDTSYKEVKGMESYGMSFDTFTVIWNKIFNVEKIFETRHAMNGMVGWLAILFCGLLAYRLANWRAGLLTMFLMFFSPPFLGQCFNNPKDIPFAMTYIFTIYYIVRFLQQFPKPTKKISFYVALGIALAISIRIGGLLLIAYLGIFVALYYIFSIKWSDFFSKSNIEKLKKLIVYVIIISIAGYFMGLILWPYALESPINNPYKALGFMSNFASFLLQLFEGTLIWSDKLPSYYIIKYILISAPIVVLIGSVIYVVTIRKKNLGSLWAFILLFSFGFPIFYLFYKHSNVYNGWRHALFTYPPLVVIAGLGFNQAIDFIKNKKLQVLGLIVVILLSYSPIIHTIKNHPYEYVYFNETVGGVKGAYGNYEMDYYFHSLREAAEWIKVNAKKDNPNDTAKIKIGVWLTAPLSYYLRNDTSKFQIVYIDYYTRGNTDWDYAIFTTHVYINPIQLRNGTYPPANTVHTINVDGKPICAILKRNDKSDLLGYLALQKKDTINTIPLLKKAIEVLPTNEAALLNLADAYTRASKLDSADIIIKQLLKLDPEFTNAISSQAWIYFFKNDLDNALKTCNMGMKNNFRYYMNYFVAANIYFKQQNYSLAKVNLKKCIDQNQGYKPAYMMLAQIAQSEGDNDSAQRYMEIAKQLQ